MTNFHKPSFLKRRASRAELFDQKLEPKPSQTEPSLDSDTTLLFTILSLGDSLERDTGADLGDTTEKMVIQVTQSDGEEDSAKKPHLKGIKRDHHRRKKEDRNEVMEQDGDDEEANNDVDHR